DITVSPRSHNEFATALLSRSLQTGKTVFLADISKGLEALWKSGKYYSIHADLDENTGILSIELAETPGTAVIFVKARNNDENIENNYELSSHKNGHPSMQAVITRVDSLIRIIRSGAYSFAKITDIEIDETSDILNIRLSAPQVTRIHIDKGLSSRHSMIMREVEINEGEIFDLRKVMRSVENLYGTNLFELVYIDVESYNGGVGIRIHLKEKKWTVARFGLRFDETFNTEGRIILSRENILGFGNMLSFTAQTGQRTKLLMLENRNNRIYKSLYSFSLKAYRQFWKRQDFKKHSNFLNYEDQRIGTVISVGQQMDKLGNVMVQFKSETIRIRFSPSTQMKNENKELRSIVVRSQIDSYDRYPFPKKGFMNIIYIESASEVFGGTEQFAKIYWRSSFAKSHRKNTLNGTFSLGTADPSLPGIEAFTLGGDASRLNCYDLDSAGSHFYSDFLGLSDEEKRGTRLAVGKLSYRRFIPKAFYIDLIYSIGNVWEKGSVITPRSLLQSYGVMGTLTTYVGPLSFGWGVTSEGNERFYMSAGWEF
ncbi:MAG: BamA/TamA family outer membrane protein, partial [Candidatus Latescibacteria bacterium]|nr:BamA/TamA family outer membrane protein [Candidatus Latescibacterota bacterium]